MKSHFHEYFHTKRSRKDIPLPSDTLLRKRLSFSSKFLLKYSRPAYNCLFKTLESADVTVVVNVIILVHFLTVVSKSESFGILFNFSLGTLVIKEPFVQPVMYADLSTTGKPNYVS